MREQGIPGFNNNEVFSITQLNRRKLKANNDVYKVMIKITKRTRVQSIRLAQDKPNGRLIVATQFGK
jgi:hypothetical protein